MEIKDIRAAIGNGTLATRDLKKLLEEQDVRFESADDIAIRNALGDDANVDSIRQLKAEAVSGRQYKKDLIDEAVAARTAIQGDAYNAESYQAMLERSDVDYIKEERDTYEKIKGSKYSAGRQMTEENEKNDNDVIVSERYEGGK